MRVGVLALQGAFIEHVRKLEELGIDAYELRRREDLEMSLDGIVLPGGESTVQMKLINGLGMYDTLKHMILSGVPVLGTCAGLILLASGIEEQEDVCFGTMPVRVRRNAYGRQLGSFHTLGTVEGIGDVEMTFIRAPVVTECGNGVEILSRVRGDIVAVRYKRQYALSFHPELESTADAEWIYRRVFFSHS